MDYNSSNTDINALHDIFVTQSLPKGRPSVILTVSVLDGYRQGFYDTKVRQVGPDNLHTK